MHTRILALFLMVGITLQAQKWDRWGVTTTVDQASEEGYKSIESLAGRDSAGRLWRIIWAGKRVKVIAPDRTMKLVDKSFPSEAHRNGIMSIWRDGTEHWRSGDWECFKVLINTGRVGNPLDHFLLIVYDWKTKGWEICFGRVQGEDLDDPLIVGDQLSLKWRDEFNRRPLGILSEVKISRSSRGLKKEGKPPVYQLEYGYPMPYRFWSNLRTTDPDRAEFGGFQSISWEILGSTRSGGSAFAPRTFIPTVPGKQIWSEGDGPVVWFPEAGGVEFNWDDSVEVRRFGKSVEKVSPKKAAELAESRAWGVVLTRDPDGAFLGSMLVRSKPDLSAEPESSGTLLIPAEEQQSDHYADPIAFEFEAHGKQIKITNKWQLTINHGGKRIRQSLRHRKNDQIEKVTYASVPDGVIIFLQCGDGDASGGEVIRLSIPSGKVVWAAKVPAFNILGMLEGRHLFVTGIGFVGCIDPGTGRFRWKHGDLYDRQTADFNWIQAIRVEGGRVVFVSGRPDLGKKQPENSPRTLQIDLKTGQVLGE